MELNELLSTSFLFSIAIIVILVGGMFAYINYRMSEQDHKISSMVGLISTMAEEMQFFRSKLSSLGNKTEQNDAQNNKQVHINTILDPNLTAGFVDQSNLISVSDDDISDSESGSESDSESGSDDDSNLEDLDSVSDDEELDEDFNDIDVIEDLNVEENQGGNIVIDMDNIKSIHLEEPIELSYDHEHDHQEHIDELLSSDLKTISISDFEDSNKKTDYKKMSLTKLREVVLEKGLVTDASKLKKNELFKLLGDE